MVAACPSRLLLWWCGPLLLLAGCAVPGTRTGSAAGPNDAGRGQASVAMSRLSLPMGDISSGGTAVERILPVYPTALLASCPAPVEVRVRVGVNRAGRVDQVSGAGVDATAATHWHAYFLAARTAVMRWRFNPLHVTHWAADVDGNSHVVDSTSEPFQRIYAFRFACHAGKAAVSLVEDSHGPRSTREPRLENLKPAPADHRIGPQPVSSSGFD